MQKVITLRYAGKDFTLTSNEDGMFDLRELYSKSPVSEEEKKKPTKWMRTKDTKALISELLKGQISPLKVEKGRYGKTWAIEEVVYAYASWISAEFHAVVLEAFTAAVAGDGEKAVKVAQTAVRVEGIGRRKVFAQQLARNGANKGDYGSQTDVIYLTLHGKPAKELKEERGVKKSGSLRDVMSDFELQQISTAEALAALKMMSGDRSRGDMRKAVFEAAHIVKSC